MSDKRRYHNNKKPRQDNYKPPFNDAVLAEPVTNLSLREETSSLLSGAGITTVGDVLKRTETDFYKISHFNKKNLLDVKQAVKKRNLFLKPLPVPQTEEVKGQPAQKSPDKKEQPKDNSGKNKPQEKQQQKPQKPQQKPSEGQKTQGKNEKKQHGEYVMKTLIERPPKPAKVTVKEDEPDKYVKINKGGLWGFKDRNSKELAVPAVYDEVFNFKEELCCVQKGDKFGFVNRQGEEVIPVIYDCATSFSEGLACVYKGETCGYINAKNETVIDFKFDAGTPVENGECRVKKAGKWGELHVEDPSSIRWIV